MWCALWTGKGIYAVIGGKNEGMTSVILFSILLIITIIMIVINIDNGILNDQISFLTAGQAVRFHATAHWPALVLGRHVGGTVTSYLRRLR